jgi:hypothetical protein
MHFHTGTQMLAAQDSSTQKQIWPEAEFYYRINENSDYMDWFREPGPILHIRTEQPGYILTICIAR